MSAKKKSGASSFASALSGQSPARVASGEGSAKETTRRLTLDLVPDAHKAFRTTAAELDTTMKAMLVAFVDAVADGEPQAREIAERARGVRR